jgi:translation initiation factor IF-2
VSGRRPIPRHRVRVLPAARRDPARASAAPAGPRPRRELPGDGAAPGGRAAVPGFRPGAVRPPGTAASAGRTGSVPEHKRWPTGTPHGPAGPAARSREKRPRIPGQSSRGQRRDQAGHTPRARTDPLARTGPPDRSPPPTRTGLRHRSLAHRRLAHRKGRSGRRPEARTGQRAGSTGPCPALLRRRTEVAAFADSASLRRPTSRAKTTTPIPAGPAGPGNPVSPRHPACRHRARSASRADPARSAGPADPAHRDRSTGAADDPGHPADPLCSARLTDRADPARTAERPDAAGLARSAGLAGSMGRAGSMDPGSAGWAGPLDR